MKKFYLLIFFICFYSQNKAQIITTYAGTGTFGYGPDNVQATASNIRPGCVATDQHGNLFFGYNNRIRKVDTNGIITTLISAGTYNFKGICFDCSGNMYAADYGSKKVVKISDTGLVTVVAGGGPNVNIGTGIPADSANMGNVFGVAADCAGNVYVSSVQSLGYQTISHIYKISPSGIISNYAGCYASGWMGDGIAATATSLNIPMGLATDNQGNVYVADQGNNRIRKIDTNGIITTIAGNGYYGYSEDGGLAVQASLDTPNCVATDIAGNVYFTDNNGDRIRKIEPSGMISPVTGNGSPGFSGDNGSAKIATIARSTGIAVNGSGIIYISDNSNYRIRKVSSTLGIGETVNTNKELLLYPNPANNKIYLNTSLEQDKEIDVFITDILGKTISSTKHKNEATIAIDIAGLYNGVYLLKFLDGGKQQSFVFTKN